MKTQNVALVATIHQNGRQLTQPHHRFASFYAPGANQIIELQPIDGNPFDSYRVELWWETISPYEGWLPFRAMLMGPTNEIRGARAPGLLYGALTDIPSVTILPSCDPDAIQPYVLAMRLDSRTEEG